jgi:multidrug efflux pump subunit AcrA (membrane-fusion protein)
MKKIIIFILIIIIAIGLFSFFKKKKTGEDLVYKDIEIKMRTIDDYVEVTGQIEPLNRVEVLPPSGGRIEKIFVEEGDYVRKGRRGVYWDRG